MSPAKREEIYRRLAAAIVESGACACAGTTATPRMAIATMILAAGIADCPEGKDSCPGNRAVGFFMSVGVYTAIGTGIDAAITERAWIPAYCQV